MPSDLLFPCSAFWRRAQECPACGIANVATGPRAHVEAMGDAFLAQHATCTGEHPRLVGMAARREAHAAKRAAEKAAERALANGAPPAEAPAAPVGPRQQAFAEVFGPSR